MRRSYRSMRPGLCVIPEYKRSRKPPVSEKTSSETVKSPNRPQIGVLRVGKIGQKHYTLAIIESQITVETPFQLLFRQSLSAVRK